MRRVDGSVHVRLRMTMGAAFAAAIGTTVLAAIAACGSDEDEAGGATDAGFETSSVDRTNPPPTPGPLDGGGPDAAPNDAGGDVAKLDGACMIQYAGGGTTGCVLKGDGSVWCGGGASGYAAQPVSSLGYTVLELVSGGGYWCARRTNGELLCWGSGETGLASPAPVSTPTKVMDGVLQVTAGGSGGCAVTTAGKLVCWGDNQHARIGDGTTTPSRVPVEVTALGANVAFASTSDENTCAITKAGTLYCWGQNGRGEAGIGAPTTTPPGLVTTPQLVATGGGTVAKVAVARSAACLLDKAGAVACWGIGNSYFVPNDEASPKAVALGKRATDIATGYDHVCALLEDGTVKCWGDNRDGDLGHATSPYFGTSTPGTVTEVGNDNVALSLSRDASCVRKKDGRLACWGWNPAGELLTGTSTNRPVPDAVRTDAGVPLAVVAVDTNYARTCAVTATHQVACWGDNPNEVIADEPRDRAPIVWPTLIPTLGSDVAKVTVGTNFFGCILRQNGTVACWGVDYNKGVLGDGTYGTNTYRSPVNVTAVGSDVVDITTGFDHTCALKADGTLYCWGDNYDGQIGNGEVMRTGPNYGVATPAKVEALGATVKEVCAGDAFTCARTDAGKVHCWGSPRSGALGLGAGALDAGASGSGGASYPLPQEVSLGGTATKLRCAGAAACAKRADGSLVCWGANPAGGLGTVDTSFAVAAPSPVPSAGTTFTDFFVGAPLCVVEPTGALRCLGWNVHGNVGDGTFAPRKSMVAVDAGGAVSAVTAGSAEGATCVVRAGGALSCWGHNQFAQIGNGRFTWNIEPKPVLLPCP